jgi:hypothetical protein
VDWGDANAGELRHAEHRRADRHGLLGDAHVAILEERPRLSFVLVLVLVLVVLRHGHPQAEFTTRVGAASLSAIGAVGGLGLANSCPVAEAALRRGEGRVAA